MHVNEQEITLSNGIDQAQYTLRTMDSAELQHYFETHFHNHEEVPYRVDPLRAPRETDHRNATFTLYPVQRLDDLIHQLKQLPANAEFRRQVEFVVTPDKTLLFAFSGGPTATLPTHMEMSERVLSMGQMIFSDDLTQIIGLEHQSHDFPVQHPGHYLWPLAILNQMVPERITNLSVYHSERVAGNMHQRYAVSEIKQQEIAGLLPENLDTSSLSALNNQTNLITKALSAPQPAGVVRQIYLDIDSLFTRLNAHNQTVTHTAPQAEQPGHQASNHEQLVARPLFRRIGGTDELILALRAVRARGVSFTLFSPAVEAVARQEQPAIFNGSSQSEGQAFTARNTPSETQTLAVTRGKRHRHSEGFYSEANQAQIKRQKPEDSNASRTTLSNF